MVASGRPDHPLIGILMLETSFPRYVGDVGNPLSFDFPVRYKVVPGATPEAIVQGDLAPWVNAFVAAGQALVTEGCKGLGTTCGFLTPLRKEVAATCGVPVISSALDLIPDLLAEGRRPGILTISARSLGPAHLAAAGVPDNLPVTGCDDTHFARTILADRSDLDPVQSEADVATAAERLCANHTEIDVIVLECTNMPPYAAAITAATSRPVVSILTGLSAMQRSLAAIAAWP